MLRKTLKQWPLILLCAIVAAVAAYFIADSRQREYKSTTLIQLNEVDLGAILLQQNLQQQGQDAETKTATSAELITLPRVREVASEILEGRIAPDDIEQAVTVTPRTGTTLVEISATNGDPAFARKIADATRRAFILTRTAAADGQLSRARDDVEAQIQQLSPAQRETAAGQALLSSAQSIDTLRRVSNGGVDTVQTARVSTTPVAPKPRRSAILGFIFGALVGTGLAVLRARRDNAVRDTDELNELWELPVLGLIPETRDLKRGTRELPSAPVLEAFALARTNLRYLHVGGEVKTVVVTSAVAGEGKSTVVWNLALAAAMAQSRVLVIEADLRRPVLASRLGVDSRAGLSDVLAGLANFNDAILHTTYGTDGAAGSFGIDVVLAGMVPPSPIALLERPGARELLQSATQGYDLVLIDSPPATVVADAKVLSQYSDGVIVVSRLGQVRRPAFERLRDLLRGAGPPVLGVIVNGGASAKSYGYGYSPQSTPGGSRAPATPPPATPPSVGEPAPN